MRKPTIYEALKAKLEREPSHDEQVADVLRILRESRVELATQAQRKRRATRSAGV